MIVKSITLKKVKLHSEGNCDIVGSRVDEGRTSQGSPSLYPILSNSLTLAMICLAFRYYSPHGVNVGHRVASTFTVL